MLRFDDLSMLVKLAAAPALGLFALVILAIGATGLIDRIRLGAEEIGRVRMETTADLLTANADLTTAVKDLCYALADSQAGGDPQAAITLVEGAEGQIVAVTRRLTELSGRVDDPALKAELDRVAEDLPKFMQPIDFVKGMLGIDAQAAASFIAPLKENLTVVQQRLVAAAAAQRAAAASRVAELAAEAGQARTFALIGTLLVIAAIAAVTVFLVRALRRSILRISRATKGLADGKLDVDVADLARKDELGAIVDALAVFRTNLLDRARLAQERAEAELQAEEAKREASRRIAGNLETTVHALVQRLEMAIADLEGNARDLSGQAETGEKRADIVDRATADANANVQAVASAAEELAREAETKVVDSSSQMERLSEQADRVGDVVRLIADIASQTNLLALNATIEAARAGEAGKGFAVVASEVKALATQTAKATDEISGQITSMQAATGNAVTSISQIRKIVEDIAAISTMIAGAVEEQEAATREIARNVQRASEGTSEVADTVSGLREVAVATREASGHVLAASNLLGTECAALNTSIADAIAGLRAG